MSADAIDGGDRTRRRKHSKEPDAVERAPVPEIPFPDAPPNLPDNVITERHLDFNSITGRSLSALTIEVGKFIQSTGFESGTTGWSIDGEGNAEFNSVLIRGTFKTAETGARVQIDEPYSHIAWLEGIGLWNGHDLETGVDGRPGRIYSGHDGASDNDTSAQPYVFVNSGYWDGVIDFARLELWGGDGDFVDSSKAVLRAWKTEVRGDTLTIGGTGIGEDRFLFETNGAATLYLITNSANGDNGIHDRVHRGKDLTTGTSKGVGVQMFDSDNHVIFTMDGTQLRIARYNSSGTLQSSHDIDAV